MITMHADDDKGQQVGPTVTAASYYPEGTLPTDPGRKYYLRFTHKDGTPFRMSMADKNPYQSGEARVDGQRRSSIDLGLCIQSNPSGQPPSMRTATVCPTCSPSILRGI